MPRTISVRNWDSNPDQPSRAILPLDYCETFHRRSAVNHAARRRYLASGITGRDDLTGSIFLDSYTSPRQTGMSRGARTRSLT